MLPDILRQYIEDLLKLSVVSQKYEKLEPIEISFRNNRSRFPRANPSN